MTKFFLWPNWNLASKTPFSSVICRSFVGYPLLLTEFLLQLRQPKVSCPDAFGEFLFVCLKYLCVTKVSSMMTGQKKEERRKERSREGERETINQFRIDVLLCKGVSFSGLCPGDYWEEEIQDSYTNREIDERWDD